MSAGYDGSVSEVHVRRAIPADCAALSHLREALWPEASRQEHASELVSILAGKYGGALPLVVFVAEDASAKIVGFLEVGLRSHADGCDPRHPVGFVEGWFVLSSHRRQGVGKQLLTAAEEWARGQGCAEMASDTWIDHTLSQFVHESLGFEIVDRCVHYRKLL